MLTTIAFVETKRLILRRFRESDLQDLHEYLSDPEVVAFEPYKPQTLEEVRGNLAWRISTEEMIAVELKETGKLIGNVYLGKRDFDSIEIGFVFNGKYQHHGYAAESCEKLIDLALLPVYTESMPNVIPKIKAPGGCWNGLVFPGKRTCGKMCTSGRMQKVIRFGRIPMFMHA